MSKFLKTRELKNYYEKAITIKKNILKDYPGEKDFLDNFEDNTLSYLEKLLKEQDIDQYKEITNKIDYIIKKITTKQTTGAEKKECYSKILQSKQVSALAKTSKKSFKNVDRVTGVGVAEYEDGMKIQLENFSSLKLNVQTQKVFAMLRIKLTQNLPYGENTPPEQILKNRAVKISVSEYMDLCGLKDRKEARKQLTEALQTLYKISLEFDEVRYYTPAGKTKKVMEKTHHYIRIADHVSEEESRNPIKNGNASFSFTYDIAEHLSRSYIMPFPDALFTINSNDNPYSYIIALKLAEHHNMNYGKENENRISVRALLNVLSDIPTYEKVMRTDQHLTRRIRDPFERDLTALKYKYEILEDLHYCKPNGISLTDEETVNASFEDWRNWLIEFKLKDYPEREIKKLPAKK